MSEKFDTQPDPSAIQTIPRPPFVRLPAPLTLFANRAARLRSLAVGHGLQPYLGFLASLVEAQQRIAATAPEPKMPSDDFLAAAKRHAMPPLSRSHHEPGAGSFALIDAMVENLADAEMPNEAHAALRRVGASEEGTRRELIAYVLADTIPSDAVAEHVFVAAAMQVEFAHIAARLNADDLVAVADGACPTCGGPPVASVITDSLRYEGTRYCSCSLCGTLWNYVRAKCTLCAATGKISFREVKDGDGSIKAEVCGDCNGYVKVLYHNKDPLLDPVADDVASIALDVLLKEEGLHRGAVNPFLAGY